MIFQSSTLNNTSGVPVSAFILWPYLPRRQPDGTYPIVVWAHGTSGFPGTCAPSAYRNLLYQYATVFALVLQGYVVVAPDYAGLGVTRDTQGREIVHPFSVTPSHANDLFYSVQAARTAFPGLLSKEFVVVGHSQGGGAAWGAAVRQAQTPVEGYLGAVVGSPATDTLSLGPGTEGPLTVFAAHTLEGLYPSSSFSASDLLTPAGLGRLRLMQEIGACSSVATLLLFENGLARPGWQSNPYFQAWSNLTNPAGKPIGGPMLVIQGENDPRVPLNTTSKSVNETCARYPGSQLRYAMFEGSTHVPVMYAAQRLWLDWIADRFAGAKVEGAGCGNRETYHPARPQEAYQAETSYFLEYATQPYQVA
ncbi:MAG: hypothetical protein Q9173_007361 [Seirophora scorigena]